ncbi:MAG: glycosyltransferase [Clostridiales bacterium]|nr:glycosyltransferase [Clostridiales bacterium]
MVKVSVVILPCRHQLMIRDSLSAQTLKEIEILEKDPQSAISQARGKYILFVDRAVSAEPDALERLFEYAEEKGSDVTVAAADYYDICKEKYIPDRRFLNLGYFGGKDIILRREADNSIMNFTRPVSFNKLFRTDLVKESGVLKDGFYNAFFVYTLIISAEKTGALDEVLFHSGMNFENGEGEEISSPESFIREFEMLENFLTEKGIFEDLSFSFLKCFAAEFAYCLRRTAIPEERVDLCRKIIACSLWEKYIDRISEELPGDENASMLRSAPAIIKTHELYFVPVAHEAPVLKAGKLPEKEPLVSVVIPAYNVEGYIGTCVRSVLDQSLKDLELICIDDGSTDSTLEILTEFAREDKRVRVYSQPNNGISVTRNYGIGLTRGRYVYFLDSDDMITSEALKELSDQMERDSLDMLIFNYDYCFTEDESLESFVNGGKIFYRRNGRYPAKCDGIRLMSEMIGRNEYIPAIHGQFYRRSYLESINAYFIPEIIHEDNAFTFRNLLSCSACGYSEGRFYRRRYRSDSVMTSSVSFRNCYGYFRSFLSSREFMYRNGLEEHEGVNEVLLRMFGNIVTDQIKLPPEERYFFYGLGDGLFRDYSGWVFRQAELRDKETELKERNEEKKKLGDDLRRVNSEKASLASALREGEENIKRLKTEKTECESRLSDMTKQRNDLQGRLKTTEDRLEDTNKKKADLEAKLKESGKINAGLNDKINKITAEKNEISGVLKKTYEEKSEINRKLQQTYDEKSEINRKLKQTYEEKSEINRKLQTAYEEKSEINRKLQQTYDEKSELNRKLQQTYEEKSERGLIIKDQKARIAELKAQNKKLQGKVKTQQAEIKNLSEKLSNKIIRKVKKLFKKR